MPPTDPTEIDRAHATMQAAPDDDLARLAFYERLADCELFLLLTEEPQGDEIAPEIVGEGDQRFVLVFDREERLSEFAGTVAPYAGLSGRGLARMLVGQKVGLALNPDVAPSAMLIPATAVSWLVATLDHAPAEAAARPVELTRPRDLPEALIAGLDRKLATAGGLAAGAWLAGVVYDDGGRGHMLAFVDAVAGAESALAAAAGEALTFSGIAAGSIDVTFIAATDAIAARLARVGLRFDLPQPQAPRVPGANPGMDPDRPPRLR